MPLPMLGPSMATVGQGQIKLAAHNVPSGLGTVYEDIHENNASKGGHLPLGVPTGASGLHRTFKTVVHSALVGEGAQVRHTHDNILSGQPQERTNRTGMILGEAESSSGGGSAVTPQIPPVESVETIEGKHHLETLLGSESQGFK